MIRRWLRGCVLPSALCLSAVGCADTLEALTGGLVSAPAPAAKPAEPTPIRTDELSSQDKVRLCLDAGREMDKAGNDDGALDQYERALAMDPANFTAMRRLCVLYDRQARWDKSEEMYKKVSKARPKDADVWSDWGYSFYLRAGDKNWHEAETRLRHALELSPQHARAHSNLGLVLGHLKRYPEAFAEFKAAQLSEAEAHCDMAFVYWAQGKMDEAKHECRVARDMDTSCLKARDMLAVLEKGPRPAADTNWSSSRPRASTLTPQQWEAERALARKAATAGTTAGAPPSGTGPASDPGTITMPSGAKWVPVKTGATPPTSPTLPPLAPLPPPAPTPGASTGTMTFDQ